MRNNLSNAIVGLAASHGFEFVDRAARLPALATPFATLVVSILCLAAIALAAVGSALAAIALSAVGTTLAASVLTALVLAALVLAALVLVVATRRPRFALLGFCLARFFGLGFFFVEGFHLFGGHNASSSELGFEVEHAHSLL